MSTAALPFPAAVDALCGMFDHIDRDVIVAVLEESSEGGAREERALRAMRISCARAPEISAPSSGVQT